MARDVVNCLKARIKWYERAIEIKKGKVRVPDGFDMPEGNIDNWTGAVKELKNTCDMLEAYSKKEEKE